MNAADSDAIEYVLPEGGVELEPDNGVEYEIPSVQMNFPYTAADVDSDVGVEYEVAPVVDSVVEFPYIADNAVEEAPYEELLTLMRRSKELLERAQKRGVVRKPSPSAAPPAKQPLPQPTSRPVEGPAVQPAVRPVAQPEQAPAVTETIPILPSAQYEQNALTALAAMKAALGEGV